LKNLIKKTHVFKTWSPNKYMDTINFEIKEKITEELAVKIQEKLGWDPCGYGMYSLQYKDGKTTWNCQSSCD